MEFKILNDDVMGIIKNKVNGNDEDWIHDIMYSDFKIIKRVINKQFYCDLFKSMSHYVIGNDKKIYKNGKPYKKNIISKAVKDYCIRQVSIYCKVDTDELFKGNLKTNKVEIYKFCMSLCEKEKVMEIWNDVLKKHKPPCDCCKERNNELYTTITKTIQPNYDYTYMVERKLVSDFNFPPIPFNQSPYLKSCKNCLVPLLNENEITDYVRNLYKKMGFDEDTYEEVEDSLIDLHYEINKFISINRYKYTDDGKVINNFNTTFPKSFKNLVKHNKKMLKKNINKLLKQDILQIYKENNWYLKLPQEIDRLDTTKKRMKEIILNEWN